MGKMRTLGALAALTLAAVAMGCEEMPRDAGTASHPTFVDESTSRLAQEDQARVLAQIGDQVITLRDFERRIDAQPPYARARYVGSPERQKEFLDNLVRFEVLAAEARRKGYDRHPEVVQAMKQTMVRKMMSSEVATLVKMSDITDAELKKHYEEHRDDYHKPEQVRISHILVATRVKAETLLQELKLKIAEDQRNYRRIFGGYAKEHSTDKESRERGGDLRFFARSEDGGKQPKALADAAFAIAQVGQLGGPVQTEKGWHIILLTGKKNRYDRTFEQVKRQIQNRLYRQKKREATESFVEGLRKGARITRDDTLLARLKVEPAAAPAPTPGPIRPGPAPGPRRPIPGGGAAPKPGAPKPPATSPTKPAPEPGTTR